MRRMVAIVRKYRASLPVRMQAVSITRNLPQKSYIGEIRAIQEWVRDHIRYVRDVRDVETLITPDKVMEIGSGDCDDKAMLAASMLESIGHPTRFVAVGKSPTDFCHVLVETRYNTRWVPVETTEPVQLGWYPKGFPYRLVFTV